MTKKNNKPNGHSEEENEWFEKSHNRKFVKLFGDSIAEVVMSDDLNDKRQYEKAELILEQLKILTTRLKRRNAVLRASAKIKNNIDEKST